MNVQSLAEHTGSVTMYYVPSQTLYCLNKSDINHEQAGTSTNCMFLYQMQMRRIHRGTNQAPPHFMLWPFQFCIWLARFRNSARPQTHMTGRVVMQQCLGCTVFFRKDGAHIPVTFARAAWSTRESASASTAMVGLLGLEAAESAELSVLPA